MNTPLVLASILLSGASLFDGVSTVHFLKNPNYEEQNPLFGKRPSTLRVYGEGALIIAAEIAAGFLSSHNADVFGYLFAIGFGIQSFVHIRNGIRNLRLPV